MTDNDPTGSMPPAEEPAGEPAEEPAEEPAGEPAGEPALSRQPEPGTSQPAEDPGYLTRTGEAAGEDGSVAAIIGGLPAVEGSAWDVGAPLDERGADPAGGQDSPPDQAGHEDTRGS